MINAISNNSLLSALFGPVSTRGLRGLDERASQRSTNPITNSDYNGYIQPVDVVTISSIDQQSGIDQQKDATSNSPDKKAAETSNAQGDKQLTSEEEQQVKELKQRDQEVRRHEQAHKAAAGQYASGGPQFEYETGPDGKQYAVGGEVKIDTSIIPDNPEATVRKMQQIRRAALAPGEPSSQDRAIASQAQAAEQQAQAEIREEQTQQTGQKSSAESGQQTANPKPENINNIQSFGGTTSKSTQSQQAGELLDIIA